MFKRDMQDEFNKLMAQYPILTLMGPRQSGKTTLVQTLSPNKPYFNLEEPDTRAFILDDPRQFFNAHQEGAILDEIQRAPILISYIQSIVDKLNQKGLFILTGSHQLQLHEAVNQSLAGRTALLDLLPLSLHELKTHHISLPVDALLLNGFYPAIYANNLSPTTAYRNYVKTYIEQDIRQLINVKDLNGFHRFMQLCAGRIGSILNMESLGNDVGFSNNTIKNWLSLLEASYVIFRLPPYFENFGKRIIKSSKLYFNDVGIATYLLGIENERQINRDKMRGHLFENLVVLELVKNKFNKGQDPNLYFYRDNHQNEVDIILKKGNLLIPIEIKVTETFSPSLLKNVEFYQQLVGDRAPVGFVIYTGDKEQKIKNSYLLNYNNIHRIDEILSELD